MSTDNKWSDIMIDRSATRASEDFRMEAASTPAISFLRFTELAHRTASRYSHRSEPAKVAYTFLPHTLEHFHHLVCAAIGANTQPPAQAEPDPCPGCHKGGVCKKPTCGRLALPENHPYRTGTQADHPEQALGMVAQPERVPLGADRLAAAVARLVSTRTIDARSEAADALLDYLDIGGVCGPADVPTWLRQYEAEQLIERGVVFALSATAGDPT